MTGNRLITAATRMSDAVSGNPFMLLLLEHMGIDLPLQEKTVGELASEVKKRISSNIKSIKAASKKIDQTRSEYEEIQEHRNGFFINADGKLAQKDTGVSFPLLKESRPCDYRHIPGEYLIEDDEEQERNEIRVGGPNIKLRY